MRYRELDIARGFTVLAMPAVHVTMLYGNVAVYNSPWGQLLNWIATMPGAQLFMLLMGMSFQFSLGKKSPQTNLFKTGRWFTISYLLNFIKFIIPAIAGWLPTTLYASLGINQGIVGNLRLFLLGDILQLAALSLLCMHFIYLFALSKKYIICISVVLIFTSQYIWNFEVRNILLNQILSLLTGNDSLVYFPMFPWFLYPLIGSLLGQSMVNGSLKYSWLGLTGIVLMLPEIIHGGFHLTLEENLYRPTSLKTLYHLGFCFIWLSICNYFAVFSNKFNSSSLLTFLSKHITLIYCMQWIAVFWCIAIFPYRGLSIVETISLSFILSAFVFLLAYFITNKITPLLNL